jgi:hypothetical protein
MYVCSDFWHFWSTVEISQYILVNERIRFYEAKGLKLFHCTCDAVRDHRPLKKWDGCIRRNCRIRSLTIVDPVATPHRCPDALTNRFCANNAKHKIKDVAISIYCFRSVTNLRRYLDSSWTSIVKDQGDRPKVYTWRERYSPIRPRSIRLSPGRIEGKPSKNAFLLDIYSAS